MTCPARQSAERLFDPFPFLRPMLMKQLANVRLVQALKSVNINIKQFLNAQSKPTDVMFFASKNQLFQYTLKHNAFYPRRKIKQGDPLGSLLKEFF